MMLFRSLLNLAETPENCDFLRVIYGRWGKESCVISASVKDAEFSTLTHPLSIKAAWGGRVKFFLDRRTVAVDDDNYLITNDRRAYASACHSGETVHAVSIFFRSGLAESALGAMLTAEDHILDRGVDVTSNTVEFAEQLHPHDRIVTPLLRYISRQIDSGFEEEMWFEQQLDFLLERMLCAHRRRLATIRSLAQMRRTTRREIVRRIAWSTDFINTYYMRPLTIGDLAKSALLSQFHFIRLFHAVHGVTPFVYLQRKRAAVAQRLLLTTDLGQNEIAARAGFASTATLARQLRRMTGIGARGLRRNARLQLDRLLETGTGGLLVDRAKSAIT